MLRPCIGKIKTFNPSYSHPFQPIYEHGINYPVKVDFEKSMDSFTDPEKDEDIVVTQENSVESGKSKKDQMSSREKENIKELHNKKKMTEKRKADDDGCPGMAKRSTCNSPSFNLLGMDLNSLDTNRRTEFETVSTCEDIDLPPLISMERDRMRPLIFSSSSMPLQNNKKPDRNANRKVTLNFSNEINDDIKTLMAKYDTTDEAIKKQRKTSSRQFIKAVTLYPWCSSLSKEISSMSGYWDANYYLSLLKRLDSHLRKIDCQNYLRSYLEVTLPTLLFAFEHSRPTDELKNEFFICMIPVVSMFIDFKIKSSSSRGFSERRTISDVLSTLHIYLKNMEAHILEALLLCKTFVSQYQAITLPVLKHVIANSTGFSKGTEDLMRYCLIFRLQKRLESSENKFNVLRDAESKINPLDYIKEDLQHLHCVRAANVKVDQRMNCHYIQYIIGGPITLYNSLHEKFFAFHALGSKEPIPPTPTLLPQLKGRVTSDISDRNEIACIPFHPPVIDVIDITSDDESGDSVINCSPSTSGHHRPSASASTSTSTSTAGSGPVNNCSPSTSAQHRPSAPVSTAADVELVASSASLNPPNVAKSPEPAPHLTPPATPQPPTITPISQKEPPQPSRVFVPPFFSVDQDIPDSTTIESSSLDLNIRHMSYGERSEANLYENKDGQEEDRWTFDSDINSWNPTDAGMFKSSYATTQQIEANHVVNASVNLNSTKLEYRSTLCDGPNINHNKLPIKKRPPPGPDSSRCSHQNTRLCNISCYPQMVTTFINSYQEPFETPRMNLIDFEKSLEARRHSILTCSRDETRAITYSIPSNYPLYTGPSIMQAPTSTLLSLEQRASDDSDKKQPKKRGRKPKKKLR